MELKNGAWTRTLTKTLGKNGLLVPGMIVCKASKITIVGKPKPALQCVQVDLSKSGTPSKHRKVRQKPHIHSSTTETTKTAVPCSQTKQSQFRYHRSHRRSEVEGEDQTVSFGKESHSCLRSYLKTVSTRSS